MTAKTIKFKNGAEIAEGEVLEELDSGRFRVLSSDDNQEYIVDEYVEGEPAVENVDSKKATAAAKGKATKTANAAKKAKEELDLAVMAAEDAQTALDEAELDGDEDTAELSDTAQAAHDEVAKLQEAYDTAQAAADEAAAAIE